MNRVQNIALWYISIGIVIALGVGAASGNWSWLNGLSFSIAAILLVGGAAIFSFRSGNGMDKATFVRYVLPAILLPIVVLAGIAFYEYKTTVLDIVDVPSEELRRLTGRASLRGDRFTVDLQNETSWSVKSLVVSAHSVGKDKWESMPKQFQLSCYEDSVFVDHCYGGSPVHLEYNEEFEWSIISARGKDVKGKGIIRSPEGKKTFSFEDAQISKEKSAADSKSFVDPDECIPPKVGEIQGDAPWEKYQRCMGRKKTK